VTILTGPASEPMDRLHDRWPLTVARANWARWLDPTQEDPERARRLLDHEPNWVARPVSAAVGSVRNNGPELIEPVEITDSPSLF
jgi:putative SOS response-associated peptidase YedK